MAKFTQRHNKALHDIAAKTLELLPFIGDTPKVREERIRLALTDSWEGFSYYCKTYYPHIFTKGWCAVHERMFRGVEDIEGVVAVTGFRGSGKTVMLAIVYPIWKLTKGYRYNVQSAADINQATERTAFMLHELQNNNRLRADFPEMTPVDNDPADFYMRNHARIRSASIKQTIRGTISKYGFRPDLYVGDDIDKEDNMGSQSIGLRKMNKITQECSGAMAATANAKVIWLGNLVHPNYAICQFRESIVESLKAAGVTTDFDNALLLKGHQRALLHNPLEDAKGRSVWEEQYPTKRLGDLKAKYGSTGYQREMLGRPVIDGNMFKHEWFQKWNRLPDPSKMKRVWLYADPAWGEKGCFKAVIAIGYDGIKFYVLKVWIRQTENSKFFRYYYDAYQELDRCYKAKFRAACETTYGQARILADFDRWATDKGLPAISHRIKKIDNKENKNLRIERTETSIETAKVLFPDGQDTPTLISQYMTYPDGYVDGCDALAGCLERFGEYDIGRNRVKVRRMQW